MKMIAYGKRGEPAQVEFVNALSHAYGAPETEAFHQFVEARGAVVEFADGTHYTCRTGLLVCNYGQAVDIVSAAAPPPAQVWIAPLRGMWNKLLGAFEDYYLDRHTWSPGQVYVFPDGGLVDHKGSLWVLDTE